FSWEAFATLVTGVTAVAAAWFVGSRQLRILNGQNDLKNQEIRISLLDRRLEVYDDVHAFLSDVMRTGREAEPEFARRFIGARLKARFLFSPQLNSFLDEIWIRHCDLGLHRSQSSREAGLEEEERIEHVRKASETLKWFVESFGRLHEHFSEIRPL